ncbi:hypothetical protein CEXT_575301 [Caerostris extrusa]|uniref:Uncharacterized protein n=1 Tax=Caerostris extrusa TaxID=172846 RepID=A0AAV4WAE5_CAEEX|nr:hypothetical protein CEXT_575301 [Caerostris extrusa]
MSSYLMKMPSEIYEHAFKNTNIHWELLQWRNFTPEAKLLYQDLMVMDHDGMPVIVGQHWAMCFMWANADGY